MAGHSSASCRVSEGRVKLPSVIVWLSGREDLRVPGEDQLAKVLSDCWYLASLVQGGSWNQQTCADFENLDGPVLFDNMFTWNKL